MTRQVRFFTLVLSTLAAAPLGGCFSVGADCGLFYNCETGGSGGAAGPGGSGGPGGSAGQGGSGGSAPVCGDGVVAPDEECDDGNLDVDDECASCQSRGASCLTPVEVALTWLEGMASPMYSIAGSTEKGGENESDKCASNGPDRVFKVSIDVNPPQTPVVLTASLLRSGTAFQSVLYARKGTCTGFANDRCADSQAPAGAGPYHGGEVLSFPVQDGETWFVFVDGETAADAGDYALTLALSTGDDCNDPIVLSLEPTINFAPITVTGNTAPPHGNASKASASCSGWASAKTLCMLSPPPSPAPTPSPSIRRPPPSMPRSSCNRRAATRRGRSTVRSPRGTPASRP